MKLPNYGIATVPKAKITQYLLSLTHPDGFSKAQFFIQFGFKIEHWEQLATALLKHAAIYDVTKIESSAFGTRYVIEGTLITPDGRSPMIRSVWFVGQEDEQPRLATAYPLPRSKTNDSGT